ncbi:hypothetical protein BQ8794_170119 [Mesorhizobium prunaredense]|uniref:Uncharacterized protein n=1 Tax=Mesorhizobium prunaredense TaxID=1631249 RepID=A0A1R3V755_9HYPH|nr:hypothetical protein BQ8794_170119 [Mesorhizobium prunaredense]
MAPNAAVVWRFHDYSTRLESAGNSLSWNVGIAPMYVWWSSRQHRGVSGKTRRYYASRCERDRVASFRLAIAVMAELTIDLGRGFRR